MGVRLWRVSVAFLAWVAGRGPQGEPGGSCSQEQARRRDVSEVLSVGLWTPGSAWPGHLLLVYGLDPGGRFQGPQLGGAAPGLFAFTRGALDSKSGGPRSLPAGFSMGCGKEEEC